MASQTHSRTEERVTYVEFSLSSPTHPFVAVSALEGGETQLREFVPRGGGSYAEFFSISDVEPETVLSLARDHPSADGTLVERFEDGGLFEFVVDDHCPAVFLGEAGALPRTVEASGGSGTIGAEVPPSEDAGTIVDRFLDAYSDAELTRKRGQSYRTPIFGQRCLRAALDDDLTDRQRDIIETAHEAGYYDWPREVTAEELAERFDISPPTFHQHLRTAEQKLIAMTLRRT
ncbi:Bacterio-opsin activator HTH domain-containing protein [Halorubrum saccharovorum DSM 1137]|uniref:Bacterio-opsin activator HTH domain-containing protein n=1 Tax=Halorubrum saccharovorum DSM 1137 TaxID=1227484 RepID=M0E361_9EURY|nr:bacterio-opsin activator domain-containing protein [Halorubrum saccharovorum]ELZ42235.1 Bacterio-opsin activator HTH domain-containing protein [Halorubrum saccharovorum DSM 1137]